MQVFESELKNPPAIPGYQLLEKLGEGGMGEVHRALQIRLHRIVAVKFLASFTQGRQNVLDFQRETRLMGALQHPHVMVIHDYGEVDGRPYLVMEYVAGPSLRSQLTPEDFRTALWASLALAHAGMETSPVY